MTARAARFEALATADAADPLVAELTEDLAADSLQVPDDEHRTMRGSPPGRPSS